MSFIEFEWQKWNYFVQIIRLIMVLYFHFHFHFFFHFCFHGSSSFIISPHFHDDSSSDYWANSPPILTDGVESESSTMEKKEGSAVPLRVIVWMSCDGLLSLLVHTASSWQEGNSRTVSKLSQSTASLVIWKFTDNNVFHVIEVLFNNAYRKVLPPGESVEWFSTHHWE